MKIEKIKKQNWKDFVSVFNRLHKNWYASLQENYDEGNSKVLINEFRLKDISLNLEKGEYNNVAYIHGKKDNEETNHLVLNVKNISLEKDDAGNDKAIISGREEGPTTVVEFRTAKTNVMLDGIV